MKKILFVIAIGMSLVTIYFIAFWQPSSKEVTGIKEERMEEKRVEEERLEMEKEKIEGKEKNLQVINKIESKLKDEDKEIVENIISNLSAVDLMMIKGHLEEGNIVFAKKIISERLLNEEVQKVFEIINKYK